MSGWLDWTNAFWLVVLGEALLHSLWQGIAFWMLLALVVAWRRKMSAERKNILALAALSLLAICPMMNGVKGWVEAERRTATQVAGSREGIAEINAANPKTTILPNVGEGPPLRAESNQKSGRYEQRWRAGASEGVRWFAVAWMFGVGAMILRGMVLVGQSPFIWSGYRERSGGAVQQVCAAGWVERSDITSD